MALTAPLCSMAGASGACETRAVRHAVALAAPAARAFEVLTDPRCAHLWVAAPGAFLTVPLFEPRTGGRFVMHRSSGCAADAAGSAPASLHGVFHEVRNDEASWRLVATVASSAHKDVLPYVRSVTVEAGSSGSGESGGSRVVMEAVGPAALSEEMDREVAALDRFAALLDGPAGRLDSRHRSLTEASGLSGPMSDEFKTPYGAEGCGLINYMYLALNVPDLDKCLEFYVRTLGFNLRSEWRSAILLAVLTFD